MFGSGDTPLQNAQLQLSNGAITFSNPLGEYVFSNVPYGNHTISQAPSSGTYMNACSQPSLLNISSTIPNLSNIDFMDSVANSTDLGLWMYSTMYVPGGANAFIKIFPLNYSTDTVQAIVSFVLNDSLIYNYSNPVPDNVTSTPNGDSLTWIVAVPHTYFFPSWWSAPPIQVFVNTPTSYSAGLFIQSCGSILPSSGIDSNLSNNQYCVNGVTATSFDPNDKTVNPIGFGSNGGITLNDSVLEYMIRFQNTGTAEAMNIKILDTLSSKLDINTFEVLASSHNYMVEVLNGTSLQFKFNDIHLPDSNTNEPLSHGFIAYRIHQKTGNSIGDEIKNTAHIYFDFNSPVVTNTTLNTIISPNAISELNDPFSFSVYPSPARDELNIIMKETNQKELSARLLNALGQPVRSFILKKAMSGIYKIPVSEFENGHYILEIRGSKGVRRQKVLIAN